MLGVDDRRFTDDFGIGGVAGNQPGRRQVEHRMHGVADPDVQRTRLTSHDDWRATEGAPCGRTNAKIAQPAIAMTASTQPAINESDCARSGSSSMRTSPRTKACSIRRSRKRYPLTCSRVVTRTSPGGQPNGWPGEAMSLIFDRLGEYGRPTASHSLYGSKNGSPNGSWPRSGIDPRRMVKSYGTSSTCTLEISFR